METKSSSPLPLPIQPSREWDNVPMREHSQSILDNLASRTYKRMRALQILGVVIPWDTLSKEEEEILWTFFSELPR